MNKLINSVTKYLNADTPSRRVEALQALIEAYRQAKNEPEVLTLPAVVMGQIEELSRKAGFEFVEDFLTALIEVKDSIIAALTVPVVEPAGIPEIIIRPLHPVTNTIARIGQRPGAVFIIFPEKRDDFREVVRQFDYVWDGEAWAKTVSGNVPNVAAEIGHRLLAAGFWIAPPTGKVRDLIIEESFEPEHKRKVMVRATGKYKGWFTLWWARSEDCYEASRKITGSRYDKPVVVVPPEFYDQVEDFAERYKFYITPAAIRAIEEAKSAINSALLLQVDLPEFQDDTQPGLEAPTGMIDDDLADYD